MKLLQKLLLSILILVLITSISIGSFSYFMAASSTHEMMMSKVETQLKLRSELIQERINSTKNTIKLVSTEECIKQALDGNNYPIATHALDEVKNQYRDLISLIAIVDPASKVIVSNTENKAVLGTDLSDRDYIKDAIKTKQLVISDAIVSKSTGVEIIAVCVPLFENNQYKGAVVATIAFELISDVVADTKVASEGYGYMIDVTGDNAGTFVAHPIASKVENSESLYDTHDARIDKLTDKMIANAHGEDNYTYDGQAKYVRFQHIENWALAITANESDLNATSRSIRNVTIIAIILGILLSFIVSYALVKRIITEPIKSLEDAMASAGEGNLTVSVHNQSKDEIGSLSRSFMKMIDSLKDVLTTINVASDQVSSGATQLSDSSMALSQGATEQASAVEELTSTIDQISTQTAQNADNANQAKSIVEDAKTDAETGNNQMQEMLQAMEAINESSNNISKIIKVIDDIAFQTNILALNAAVEAARAGEHGKGFAVVAEEVRNLAAQSADAAKETTLLIEGSIEKVKDGTSIANQTAESLHKIVEQVKEATELVNNIAVASTEQSHGVNQVNQGIMQISDVVQTTSATAEETAAASEELSGQATLLQSKVSTFKLTNTGVKKPMISLDD